MGRRSSPGDVRWTLPGKRRPFAYTTVATSMLVSLLAEDGHTVSSAVAAVNFDEDAKSVLRTFEDHGYGDSPLRELVR